MKKNLFSLITLVVLTAALSACGGSENTGNGGNGGNGSSSATVYCDFHGVTSEAGASFTSSSEREKFEKAMEDSCTSSGGTVSSGALGSYLGICEIPSSALSGLGFSPSELSTLQAAKATFKIYLPDSMDVAVARGGCTSGGGTFTAK